MKKLFMLAGVLSLAAPLAFAQTSTWVPDKAHSGVDFSILHLSLSKVRGHFGNIGGSIVMNEADVSKSTVNVTIDVSTCDTGVSARDNDLKGPNIFDAAQFPTATFVSTSVAKSGNGLTVTGNLTLHGVTKPIVLDVSGAATPIKDPMGNMKLGGSATTRINRQDFGVAWNKSLDSGGVVVGDQVDVTIDLELVKK